MSYQEKTRLMCIKHTYLYGWIELSLCLYQLYIEDLQIVCEIVSCMHACMYAKQKHPGCKKVQDQSEAALQIGMCDQKL